MLNIIALAIFFVSATYSAGNPLILTSNTENEDGMGGTGHSRPVKNPTLFINGHITAFGSIDVNGIHINYNKKIPIAVNGVNRSDYKFRIGQTVEVQAYKSSNSTHALRINVIHEVIGKVTSHDIKSGAFTILGQTIIPPATQKSLPAIGQWLEVSGYTDNQGIIHATQLSQTKQKRSLLTGRLYTRNNNYYLRNINIQTDKRIKLYNGQYLILAGSYKQNRFKINNIKKTTDINRIRSIKQIIVQGFIVRLPNGTYTIGNSGAKLPTQFGKTHAGKRLSFKLTREKSGQIKIDKIWQAKPGRKHKIIKRAYPAPPKFEGKKPENDRDKPDHPAREDREKTRPKM